jgi:hypothetical protein
MELGGAAGDIQSRNPGPIQDREDSVHHLMGHDLVAVRPGVHVAMLAGLITELSHICLENGEALTPKGHEPRLGESGREASLKTHPAENPPLGGCGRERSATFLKSG